MPRKKKTDEVEFLPDIYSVINSDVDLFIEDEEDFIEELSIKYDLPFETVNIIVNLFFEEMRNVILSGKQLLIKFWGTMYISSPMTSGNKKMIFPKFRNSQNLVKRLNETK